MKCQHISAVLLGGERLYEIKTKKSIGCYLSIEGNV